LKARGIRYVLIEKTDFRSEDFQVHTSFWGMKRIGEIDSRAWLYHIE
jgi:hypothetical protein